MMKKVLLICPTFFEYHLLIKKEIETRGFVVDYFDDRPKMGVLGKGIMRLNKHFLKSKIESYFKKLRKKTFNVEYEKVIVILGQSFNKEHYVKLKSDHPNSQFVYYTWDAIANFPHTLESSKVFDKAYSFDPIDCENYDHLNYLPLFFSKRKSELDIVEKNGKALIFTTIKKGKLKKINEMISVLSKHCVVDKRMYLQSRWVYIFYKLFDRDFAKMKMSDFIYRKLSYDESCTLINNYSYLLDVPMENQNGYTIRTFEALALETKLITTNPLLKKSDCYNKKNIAIFPNDDLGEFVSTKFEKNDILEKHHISEFVGILLEN